MAVLEPYPVPALYVMVAGLPRKGKSTGLNNIFDLDLPAGLSATPITDKVVSVPVERNDISLTVTDTPGLKAAHANKDNTTLKEMKRIGENKVLLLLTLPVSPSSCITEDYRNILGNLNTIMGPEIWNWCLVLLTFSDSVRESNFHSDQQQQGYQDYLKSHCQALQRTLANIGVSKAVKPFFEYTSGQFENVTLDGIVAIPVGKDPAVSTQMLFPLQPWTHDSAWTDIAFAEISKLSRKMQQEESHRRQEASQLRTALIQFRYGGISYKSIIEAGMNGAAQGAGMGSEIGALVGDIIGGIVGAKKKEVGFRQGRGFGKLLGEIIGTVSGALGIGGAAAVVHVIKYFTQVRKMEKRILELEQT